MDKQTRKRSPMEFLAQLKAGGKSSKHLPGQGTRSPGELNIDLSDLAATAPASANGPTTGEQSASGAGTAVAEPRAAPRESDSGEPVSAAASAESRAAGNLPADAALPAEQ